VKGYKQDPNQPKFSKQNRPGGKQLERSATLTELGSAEGAEFNAPARMYVSRLDQWSN